MPEHFIQITEADIAGAIQGSPGSCPIARALNREYLGGRAVVGPPSIWVTIGGRRTEIKTSSDVLNFVQHFDEPDNATPEIVQPQRLYLGTS